MDERYPRPVTVGLAIVKKHRQALCHRCGKAGHLKRNCPLPVQHCEECGLDHCTFNQNPTLNSKVSGQNLKMLKNGGSPDETKSPRVNHSPKDPGKRVHQKSVGNRSKNDIMQMMAKSKMKTALNLRARGKWVIILLVYFIFWIRSQTEIFDYAKNQLSWKATKSVGVNSKVGYIRQGVNEQLNSIAKLLKNDVCEGLGRYEEAQNGQCARFLLFRSAKISVNFAGASLDTKLNLNEKICVKISLFYNRLQLIVKCGGRKQWKDNQSTKESNQWKTKTKRRNILRPLQSKEKNETKKTGVESQCGLSVRPTSFSEQERETLEGGGKRKQWKRELNRLAFGTATR
jgi:hypothetical protein